MPRDDAMSLFTAHQAERNLLHVPRHRLNTYGHRAFDIAGPSAWNSLPDPVRNPNSTESCFQVLTEDISVRTVPVH